MFGVTVGDGRERQFGSAIRTKPSLLAWVMLPYRLAKIGQVIVEPVFCG